MIVRHAVPVAFGVIEHGAAIDFIFPAGKGNRMPGIEYECCAQGPRPIKLIDTNSGYVMRSVLPSSKPISLITVVELPFASRSRIPQPAGQCSFISSEEEFNTVCST